MENESSLSKRKFILSSIVLMVITSIFISQVDAYVLRGNRVDRPNQVKYWLDTSISSIGYNAAAIHGSTAWNGLTAGRLSINVTSTTSASAADVKWYASSETNDLGQFYAQTSTSGTLTSTSIVRINTVRFKTVDGNRQKETTAHEMGHVLGLTHEDTVPSIMLSGPAWLYGTYPVQDDKDGIAHIYQFD